MRSSSPSSSSSTIGSPRYRGAHPVHRRDAAGRPLRRGDRARHGRGARGRRDPVGAPGRGRPAGAGPDQPQRITRPRARSRPGATGSSAIAPQPIILELTEHARIEDYDGLRDALASYGSGVRLAIDDAGAGYASLRHILELRPAFVKLDLSIVRGIEADPVRQALVSGLVYFAAKTGSELIAEGVETDEEANILVDLGIRFGQGYLLGRPEAVA